MLSSVQHFGGPSKILSSSITRQKPSQSLARAAAPTSGPLGEAPPEMFQGPRVPAPWRMSDCPADIHPKFLRVPGTSRGNQT
ncbi:hypothetical protein AAY473_020804 [Plecturocebus cupreus]